MNKIMNLIKKMMNWWKTPKKKFPRYVEEDERIRHMCEKHTRDQHITYHIGMRQL